jgi:hypothetical protein
MRFDPKQEEDAMKQLPPEMRAEIEKAGGLAGYLNTVQDRAASGPSGSESLLLQYGAQDK